MSELINNFSASSVNQQIAMIAMVVFLVAIIWFVISSSSKSELGVMGMIILACVVILGCIGSLS